MTYEVFETKEAAAKKLAAEVAELIRSRAAEGKGVVLGLATGATPLPFYAELIRLHKEPQTTIHPSGWLFCCLAGALTLRNVATQREALWS